MPGEDLIPTRDSLLTRLKNWDDQEGWRDFFDTYWRLIYRVAIQAGLSDAEAQDVVQATLISVAKSIHQFRRGTGRVSFKGWLLTNTRWRIKDQFRRRPREVDYAKRAGDDTQRTDEVERIPDPHACVLDGVWDREWEASLLEAAIDKVKGRVEPELYQLFDLHAVQQWPAAKVADKFGVNPSRVYAAKYKVSEMIQKEVARLKKETL